MEDWVLHYYNNREGKKTSGGNQVVANILWIQKFDEKVKSFLDYHNADPSFGRVTIDGISYRIIVARDNALGYRTYQGIIDSRIDDDMMRDVVLPTMNLYCRKVEVF